VAEPKLIQVWRLQRSEGRGGQRDGARNRGRHGARDAAPAAAGEALPAATQEAHRGARPPRGDAPGGNRAARFKKEEGSRPPRTGKPSGEREGRENAGGRNRGAAEHEPRKPAADVPARRFDKPQPARIDPDSPFAKLAALRDKLGK
jgi:ATP-dependent RNA helicase SUPV3L1/SUV3